MERNTCWLVVYAAITIGGLVCCRPAMCGVVHVKMDSPYSGPGNDWDHAYHTVTAGLSAATSGDEVWVAKGTYVECIALKSGVGLYGGFAGTEITRGQRDPATNTAILDGNLSGSVVTTPLGATETTRIDGFTIRNGSGTTTPFGTAGGAVYCSGSSPTIAHNTITSNTAALGAGVYCRSASPAVMNNNIRGNTATKGGAIYCSDYEQPTIANNTISHNTATTGGGIQCDSSGPTIANNTIADNVSTSLKGGGIYLASSIPVIVNNIIAFNSSGIYYTGTGPSFLVYKNCFYENSGGNYSSSVYLVPQSCISVDPKLADLARGDLHIQPESPCREQGADSYVESDWGDIDSQLRLQGVHVDIGADESDGTLWPITPRIIRVTTTGNNIEDGFSWEFAKRHVSSALASAVSGDEVWVASGTYFERITLASGVALYGGFSGIETSKVQRDWKSNTTVLDGSAGVQTGVATVTAPPRATASTRIDGFTIRNIKLNGTGIYCDISSPTISNNKITGTSGSGILCAENASPHITNNIIVGCGSYGIYCYRSAPTIKNNTVVGNMFGGICSNSTPGICNNIIAFNNGAGISINDVADPPHLRQNCIYGNEYCGYYVNQECVAADSGTVTADPLLADMSAGDYHLTAASPCIDAGTNSSPGPPLESFDIDGEGRMRGETVDIGADEHWPTTLNISDVKKAPDDAQISGDGAIVSATFTDAFYVEADNRTSGVRVEKADSALCVGMRANLVGRVKINKDGERCIAASSATESGVGTVAPLFLCNRALGGGAFGMQQAPWSWVPTRLQDGTIGSEWKPTEGLNNIGMLVRVVGKVTQIDRNGAYFYIDDGSGIRDGTTTELTPGVLVDNVGVRVLYSPSGYVKDDFVVITGISSCFKSNTGSLARKILPREGEVQKVFPQ